MRLNPAPLLCGAAALAAVMRLPFLLHTGLWRDEAFSYIDVNVASIGHLMAHLHATEYHPPLYFLLMFWWIKAAGVGELALKLPVYVLSVALVPAIYLLAKTIDDWRSGIVAAVLYAVWPLSIVYSVEARPYALSALTCTLLVYLVFKAREQAMRPVRVLSIALVTSAFLYSHYVALIGVPVLLTFCVVVPGRRWIAAAIALGCLPFALWMPDVLQQMHVGADWVAPPTLAQRLSFFCYTLAQAIPAPPVFYPASLIAAAALSLLAWRRRALPVPAVQIGAIFAICITGEIVAGLPIADRYTYAFLPLALVFYACLGKAIWCGLPTARAWGRYVQTGAAAMLVATVLVCDVFPIPAISRMPHSGIRSLLRGPHDQTDALYLIAPDYLAATFAYYARAQHLPFIAFARTSHPEVFRAAGYAAIWAQPQAVARTEWRVRAASRHYRYLNVIVDDSAQDKGKLRYGKVWRLLRAIRSSYPQTGHSSYRGSEESVSVYRFALSPLSRGQRRYACKHCQTRPARDT